MQGFSFQGTELIGIAAGESENPEKTIPKAINTIFWRIILFYLGTIFVVGALIPYTRAGVQTSPFTMIFQKAGVAGAASLMNAVILTSVLSCGNSGLYASTRMLYSMANDKKAPRIFGRVNTKGVPVNAVILTTVVASACVFNRIVCRDFCLCVACSSFWAFRIYSMAWNSNMPL